MDVLTDPLLGGAAIVVALVVGAGLVAVGRGPTVFDRIVAVAHVAVSTLVLVLLLGWFSGRPDVFTDTALTYALLAFVLPIVLARYVDREGDG